MSSNNAIHRYTYNLGTLPGGQDIQSMDFMQNPFTALAVVYIVSGAVQYSIEFTTSDIGGSDPTLFDWLPLPGAAPGQTASAAYPITNFPVTAIRLNLDSISGEVRFTVIQSQNSTR